MSLNVVRVLGNNASRILSGCVRQTLATRAVSSTVLPISCRHDSVSKNFARSLIPSANYHALRQTKSHSRNCGCCGLHTEGDRELVEFLDEEIQIEKETDKAPSQLKFKGFDVSADSAEVSISKKLDGETITIKWNVNDTVSDDDMPEFEEHQEPAQGEEEEPPIISKPLFTIFINKGGPTSLALQCGFIEDSEEMPGQIEGEAEVVDPLEIHEIAMVPGTEWNNKNYSVMSSVMDGNLYALLMNTLEDRGINADFMRELETFSTHYEHKQYINFLQGLQDFARK